MTTSFAPPFRPERSDYPVGGSKIGPAWQACWDLLSDGQDHPRPEILDTMAEAGQIMLKTADNLLAKARQAGLVKKRITHVRVDGRRMPRSYYWRDDLRRPSAAAQEPLEAS